MWAAAEDPLWMGEIMTDNARKRAARDHQKAHPGTPYLQALREVSKEARQPLVARLGRDVDGEDITVNLDWQGYGGTGPHCVIFGQDQDDARFMMGHLAAGLRAGQTKGDLEVIACTTDASKVDCDSVFSEAGALTDHVDQVFDERCRTLKALEVQDVEVARDAGHQIPTIMVLLEELDREWSSSEPLTRWARAGRSLGISIVLATTTGEFEPTTDGADRSAHETLQQLVTSSLINRALLNIASTAILSLGDGRAALSTHVAGAKRSFTDFTIEAA
jgi:hypothetical protein